eukprot:COSAG02_NODE_2220_length_9474_cov_3.985280_5_plen_33_part_00
MSAAVAFGCRKLHALLHSRATSMQQLRLAYYQ